MRIQWSSNAAQETMDRLRRADHGLEDCLQMAASVRLALAEADPDSENKALQTLSARFEDCVLRMKALRDSVNAYENAVRRTDESFRETEAGILRRGEALGKTDEAPIYVSGEGFVNWGPGAFTVMPDMRINTVPLPLWLVNAAAEADTDQFLG